MFLFLSGSVGNWFNMCSSFPLIQTFSNHLNETIWRSGIFISGSFWECLSFQHCSFHLKKLNYLSHCSLLVPCFSDGSEKSSIPCPSDTSCLISIVPYVFLFHTFASSRPTVSRVTCHCDSLLYLLLFIPPLHVFSVQAALPMALTS